MINTTCPNPFSMHFGERLHNHQDPVLEAYSVVFQFKLKSCKQHTVMLKCTLETTKIFGTTCGGPGCCLLNYNGYGWPLHFSCSSKLCSVKVFSFLSLHEPDQREELNFKSGLESCLH